MRIPDLRDETIKEMIPKNLSCGISDKSFCLAKLGGEEVMNGDSVVTPVGGN